MAHSKARKKIKKKPVPVIRLLERELAFQGADMDDVIVMARPFGSGYGIIWTGGCAKISRMKAHGTRRGYWQLEFPGTNNCKVQYKRYDIVGMVAGIMERYTITTTVE